MPLTPSGIPTLKTIGDILLGVLDDGFKQPERLFPRLMRQVTADRETETVLGLVYFPRPEEATSPAQPLTFKQPAEGYKTEAKVRYYYLATDISEATVKFDKTGRLRNAAAKFGRAFADLEEMIGFRLFNNMLTTTHAQSGKPLVSDTQIVKGTGGSFDNRIDSALSVAGFESALIQFGNMPNEQGIVVRIVPRFLSVPLNLRRIAQQLIGSEKEPFTSDNQINVYKNEVVVVVSPYMTSAANWMLSAAPDDTGLYYGTWQPFRRAAWVDEETVVQTLKFKGTIWIDSFFADWRGTVGGVG